MTKDMSPGNRPNFNADSGLTPTGRGPAGERPGSAPERNAAGSPRASRPALRRLFASATPASAAATPGRSGGPPAGVDELVAPLGRPGLDAGGDAATAAAAEPVAGLGTEASRRPRSGAAVAGPDVAPDVLPTAGSGAHDVGRRVEVLAAAVRPADRTRTFTLALGDLVVAGG